MANDAASDNLTVFYYGTFLPVANGGNARLADLLDRLREEFDRIILYSYADHPDFPWTAEAADAFRARWPTIELVLENYAWRLRQVTRLKNLLLSIVPPRAAGRVLRLALPGATPKLEAVKRGTGAFVVSYTEGLTQLNGIDPRLCLVETHDVNFVKWSKINGRRTVSGRALRKLRGEITALEQAHGLVAISAGEAAFFRMMLSRPVAFVPTWTARGGRLQSDEPKDYDLVFVGSGYIMNVRGICGLIEAHGPWLARYRLAICGLVAEDPAVRQVAAPYPNIELLGFVDEIDNIYRRSHAAVSPVDGTGTKMKVLAALAAGLPVFASPQSREGLPPGHEGAVFPISQQAVDDLLGSPARLQAAGACALRYMAQVEASGESDAAIQALSRLIPTNAKPVKRGGRHDVTGGAVSAPQP